MKLKHSPTPRSRLRPTSYSPIRVSALLMMKEATVLKISEPTTLSRKSYRLVPKKPIAGANRYILALLSILRSISFRSLRRWAICPISFL